MVMKRNSNSTYQLNHRGNFKVLRNERVLYSRHIYGRVTFRKRTIEQYFCKTEYAIGIGGEKQVSLINNISSNVMCSWIPFLINQ